MLIIELNSYNKAINNKDNRKFHFNFGEYNPLYVYASKQSVTKFKFIEPFYESASESLDL